MSAAGGSALAQPADAAQISSAEEMKIEGNEFFKVGKFADAIVSYTKAIALHPRSVRASASGVSACVFSACAFPLRAAGDQGPHRDGSTIFHCSVVVDHRRTCYALFLIFVAYGVCVRRTDRRFISATGRCATPVSSNMVWRLRMATQYALLPGAELCPICFVRLCASGAWFLPHFARR
jgi:hypothetical protein